MIVGISITAIGLAILYWVPGTSHFLKDLGAVLAHTGIVVALLDALTHRHLAREIATGISKIRAATFEKIVSEGIVPELYEELKRLLLARPLHIVGRTVEIKISTSVESRHYIATIADEIRVSCHNAGLHGSIHEISFCPAISNNSHDRAVFTAAERITGNAIRPIYPELRRFSVFTPHKYISDKIDYSKSTLHLKLRSKVSAEIRGAIYFQFSEATLAPATFRVEHDHDVPVRAHASREGLISFQGRIDRESIWTLQRPAFSSDSITFSFMPAIEGYEKLPLDTLPETKDLEDNTKVELVEGPPEIGPEYQEEAPQI